MDFFFLKEYFLINTEFCTGLPLKSYLTTDYNDNWSDKIDFKVDFVFVVDSKKGWQTICLPLNYFIFIHMLLPRTVKS